MVIAISDCVGGGLGMEEPGFLADMDNGDMVIFRSASTTHFNLDYKGKRASMVFHTDRASKGWVEDSNGWGSCEFFH